MFFFQAEDGIRDYKVTGVQTCALPIFLTASAASSAVGESCGTSRSAAIAALRSPRRSRQAGSGDRESGVEGKRVDLGGGRIIKKKKEQPAAYMRRGANGSV